MQPQAWIEVDATALAHNARVFRRTIPTGTRLGILVKANGYGHGMLVAARAAVNGGADQLMIVSIASQLACRRRPRRQPKHAGQAGQLDAGLEA